jgi:O-antigen chain-terminating methyltransferase
MKISIAPTLKTVPRFLYLNALRSIARSYEPYHPVQIDGRELCAGERMCVDRWSTIHRVLKEHGAQTLLDLGTAEGYFVQQAALNGYFVVGVDADVRRLTLAQASITLNRVSGAGFMFAELSPEFIARIPKFDAVLFLSVLHHIMYEHGVDYAREYMSVLRSKIDRVLIFDMGQSNETENAWATLLPDMGQHPHTWIADFLRSAGYSSAEKLQDTDAYQGSVKRALFKVFP